MHPASITGKERDTESGLDYFGARYYASSMGRWMSPDWADKPEAVPYSVLSDPQSLNLYAYVVNNPLSGRDVDGHVGEHGDTWDQFDANVASAHGVSSQVLNAVFGQNSPDNQKAAAATKPDHVATNVYPTTPGEGSQTNFFYEVQDRSNQPITGSGWEAIESITQVENTGVFEGVQANTTSGTRVKMNGAVIEDSVGSKGTFKQSESGRHVVTQTFKIAQGKKVYRVSTKLEHVTTVKNGKADNNVIVLKP